MTPQIDNAIENKVQIIEIPSKTYKLNINEFNIISSDNEQYIEGQDRIIGFVDNIDAIKQSVYHILNTERYAYLIYEDNYGIELNQFKGQGFEFLEMNIEDVLKEALTYDLRIINVVVNEINEINKDSAEVKFTVQSIYGDLQVEVNIND